MPVKKKPVETNDTIALQGIDYFNKKEQIKLLDKDCKVLRGPLEDYLDTNGKTLESGHKVSVIPYADAVVTLKKTLRSGKVLLPEAIDVLTKNGLGECIENIPTVREDRIEALYNAGKISDEILKQIYTNKDTYAFSVDVKQKFSDTDHEG